MPRLRRARGLPRVRARQRREVRHLGRHERARAPPHPPPAGPGPGGRRRRGHDVATRLSRRCSAARARASMVGPRRGRDSAHRRGGTAASTRRGTSPTSSAPGHRRLARRRRRRRPPGRPGPGRSGSSTPAPGRPRRARAPGCRPRTAAATRPGPLEVGLGQPEVVGDEDGPGADRDRTGRRVGRGRGIRRRSGASVGEGAAGAPRAACGRRSPRPVDGSAGRPVAEAGRAELLDRPADEAVAGGARRRPGSPPSRGTKGTTSTTPIRGWAPSWARRSSRASTAARHRRGASSPTG